MPHWCLRILGGTSAKGLAIKMYGIKANFIFNVVGTIAPLFVALVTVPIYVSHIGASRYGILSIVWFLLGYFGFLDFGLSRASVNALSKLKHSSSAERSKVIITAVYLNLGLGAVGSFILYFVAGFLLEHLLSMPATLKPEVATALPWIAALLPLAMVSGVMIGTLESRDQFFIANLLQFTSTTIGQVLPVLCAVLISPSLSIVIPAAVLSRGLSVLLTFGFVLYEERPLNLQSFDANQARALIGYGGWLSVSAIINPLLMSLDQWVIGSVLGVAAVSHYAVPMNLAIRSQILPTAMSRTLFPHWSRSTREEANGLAEKALVAVAYSYGAICAPAIVLISPFMKLWMGVDFGSVAGPVAELLLIGAWINGLSYIPSVLLQGQQRPDVVAKFHALEILPFLFVLWFLTSQFGLMGSAVAWVLRVLADAALLFGATRFWASRFRVLLVPLGFVLVAYLFTRILHPTLFQGVSFASILAIGIIISGFLFDAEMRGFILATIKLRRFGKNFMLTKH
jgi:O-antigen/teichoic acid export membrane protein